MSMNGPLPLVIHDENALMRQFLKKIADFLKIEYLNVHNRNVNANQMISKMLSHNSQRSFGVILGHLPTIHHYITYMNSCINSKILNKI